MTNGNDYAFPTSEKDLTSDFCGLAKRELFAAMAMQGMLANPQVEGSEDSIAKWSIANADALISQLNSGEPTNGD